MIIIETELSYTIVGTALAATHKELGLLINFGPSVETHRILRPLRVNSKQLLSRSGNSSNSDVPSPVVER